MLGRRKRSLSQRCYLAVQAIHAENDRLKQIDRGIGYGHVTPDRRGGMLGAAGSTSNDYKAIDRGGACRPAGSIPIHVGPQIEAVRDGDGWAA